jgi:hypothetical protein
MTELIEGLERIYRQFEAYAPHHAHALQQPLSREEIETIVKSFPFSIPPEVYELYQWRNGCSWGCFLFQNYDFMSLNRVVNEYQGWLRQVQADDPEMAELFQFRLPLFELWSECGVFLTVVPDEQEGSAIYDWDTTCKSYAIRYNSLTDLILYNAEWYETAVFDEVDDQWVIDGAVESQINLKYRPSAQANKSSAAG